tara:strand:- start:7738 stop:7914 length:177 start_codon:yes stop_codon:yes gene_type:complete
MIEIKSKDGNTILAHPSKVQSLLNMGWILASEEKPAPEASKKAKPQADEIIESVEEEG